MKTPTPPPPLWLSGLFWRSIGIGATVLWMVLILWTTGGNPDHPRFKLLFIIPLIGWVCGLGLSRWYQQRHRR